jgi:hypothetical protein
MDVVVPRNSARAARTYHLQTERQLPAPPPPPPRSTPKAVPPGSDLEPTRIETHPPVRRAEIPTATPVRALADAAPVNASTVADLKLLAAGKIVEPDHRALAQQISEALKAGIEAGIRSRWRKNRCRAVLQNACTHIAQQTTKQLVADMNANRPITPERIRAIVDASIADVMKSMPSAFRRENVLGFGLFLGGVVASFLVNIKLMTAPWMEQLSIGAKFAVQGLITMAMGYGLAVFKPFFDDKVANQARAWNYGILKWLMSFFGSGGGAPKEKHAVEPSTQTQLGEVYISQQALDGRLQGVLGLMIGDCEVTGGSFFKALYMLNDESNPDRMQDACDLMAAIFVVSHLVFYAFKPEEHRDLYETYIYPLLEPTLRKHTREHGEEMFERVMTKIRASKPAPSEETLKSYYEPFVRGAFGLKQETSQSELLFDEVKRALQPSA